MLVADVKKKLFSLQTRYKKEDVTARAVQAVLARYKTLTADIGNFVDPNDKNENKLMVLHGTIPVAIEGFADLRQVPVNIWLHQNYPLSPPDTWIFAKPGVVIRPSQFVTASGEIRIPYVLEWNQRSTLVEFITFMIVEFQENYPLCAAKEVQEKLPPEKGACGKDSRNELDMSMLVEQAKWYEAKIEDLSSEENILKRDLQEAVRTKLEIRSQLLQRESENSALRQRLQEAILQLETLPPQPATHSRNGFEDRDAAEAGDCSFWEVSRDKVKFISRIPLGTGAWGYVLEGSFCGKRVAVKCLHEDILSTHSIQRIKREIGLMAQLRHPNLVLFIASALGENGVPMLITELMDTSLRKAYQNKLIFKHSALVHVFRDIALALNYLHLQSKPIVHRDVSSSNILLEQASGCNWRAKLGDFGSAKLVRNARTAGEGSYIYAAPEVLGNPLDSGSQSPAMDVYSFGTVMCEATVCELPSERSRFTQLMSTLEGVFPLVYSITLDCRSLSPLERPSMASVVEQLDKLATA